MAYKIFISHTSTDKWVATQIGKHIRALGGEPFLFERDIMVGDEFEEVLIQELNQTDELLVLLTPHSKDKKYIYMEIAVVWSRRKRIVPILYGISPMEIHSDPDIPITIKSRDIIELNSIEEKYFKELKQRIENHGK